MKNVVSLLACIFLWLVTKGQQQTCSVQGSVADGHIILAGAGVQLWQKDSLCRELITDNKGLFYINTIPAGYYSIIVSFAGYANLRKELELKPGNTAIEKLMLEKLPVTLQEVLIKSNSLKKEDDLIDVGNMVQPVTIINRKTIAQMGSRRLDEVLREQTGMAIVSDLGSGNRSVGLQMQGFGSAYIMILLNGEPMTGRFNGNFDLSRISITDIEKIEIIKGASSSLYGSEALGGVINIITRSLQHEKRGTVNARYGTYNTVDIAAELATGFAESKGAVSVSGNFYRTDGFNVNQAYLKYGQTAPPYTSMNLQARSGYKFNEVHSLNVSARWSHRHSVMDRSYGVQDFSDKLQEQDANLAINLNSRFKKGLHLLTRYYVTRYATEQSVQLKTNHTELQRNDFVQTINRLEVQAEHDWWNKKLLLTAGTGGDHQQLNNIADAGTQQMYNYFGYAQATLTPFSSFTIMAGARYDGNNVYGGKVNPSAGIRYQPLHWLLLKASYGQGFKSPTYAQLYQVFTNMIQGYTVIGANNFDKEIAALKDAGIVQQLWDVAGAVKPLRPETSESWNGGVTIKPQATLEWTVSGFYNNLRNQIFSRQVGITTSGQQLFSYFNIARSFTTGIETSLQWKPVKGLMITGGYQYLVAKDKAVTDSIRAGKATVRDVPVRTAVARDYFNLPDRSRHSATAQVFYEYAPWSVNFSLRGNYRGRYGFMDRDNNGFIDPYDIFVSGYFLAYAAVQKKLWKNRLGVQLSVDNIFNYTDYLMPAQPGRVMMLGLSYTWKSSKLNQ